MFKFTVESPYNLNDIEDIINKEVGFGWLLKIHEIRIFRIENAKYLVIVYLDPNL